jgi:hypothetical protein
VVQGSRPMPLAGFFVILKVVLLAKTAAIM